MFTFKGTVVTNFRQLGSLMAQLKNRDEGNELVLACEGEFGTDAKYVLGYLLGYFDNELRPKVMRKLPPTVVHPIWGEKGYPDDPLGDTSVGMAIALARLAATAVEPVNAIAFKKVETKSKEEVKSEIMREEAEWNF
jgi:hypothetical protein